MFRSPKYTHNCLAKALFLQDIPQTADHAASRTFYTWRVNLQDAIDQFRKDVYKATFNTHLRLMHELKKGNEVTHRIFAFDRTLCQLMELLDLAQSSHEPVHITSKQRKQAGDLSRIVQSLEKSLFDLDATIAIMTNFN